MQSRALSPSPSPSLALSPPEDTVFLRDEDERCEYVLSQQGLIYQGTRDYITSTPWNFGQVSRARSPGTPGQAQPSPCSPGGAGRGGWCHVCPPERAPHMQPASWGGSSPAMQLWDEQTKISFPRGNMLTSKCGRARGACLHGSWGPWGHTLLIRAATLSWEPVPDNALPGAMLAMPIRQHLCPELQPTAATLGPRHWGSPATLPELWAVPEEPWGWWEWGCPWPLQDPRLNSGKGCDSPGDGK